jgi:hypothetical protein
MRTTVSAPVSIIATRAAKLPALMLKAETSRKSWPPAAQASKSIMVSFPAPGA